MLGGLLVWVAFGGLADATATDRFEPTWEQDLVGLQDITFDSGWFPMDSPVQLRLFVHAADSVVIRMPGEARYEWNAQSIAFFGDEDEGRFAIDIGAQVQACVRFDVAGITWESEIFGPYDYAITSEASFTPYLLAGNPERPVQIDDKTDGVTVASVPIVPDIVIASGGLDIDVAAEISAALAGERIEVDTAAGGFAVVDTEWSESALPPDPDADPMDATGVLFAALQTTPTIIVRPHLTMSILGQDYEIVGIDVPVALPPIDDTLQFDPRPLAFDRPAAPAGDETGGEGDGSGPSDDPDPPAHDDTDPPPAGDGSSGSADTEGTALGESLEGCACRSDRDRDRERLAAPLMLVLAFARRRRARVVKARWMH